MKKLLDKIVVVDVESTCWKGSPPEGQKREIVEIGVCLLNLKNGRITTSAGIFVKPKFSTVSSFCTDLTGITQAQVDGGVSLASACQTLWKDYQCGQRTWASYGDYDRIAFHKNCELKNVQYPFSRTHINVKNLFAARMKLNEEVGMDEALKMLDMKLEGRHHCGKDDALNVARILRWAICCPEV